MFQGKFRENIDPKNEMFPKFCHNIQNFSKNCNFKILTKMKILESIVYVISQLFFWGKEITRGGGEILPKVLPKLKAKFWENFVRSCCEILFHLRQSS